jgi:hypothetical protein
MIMRNSVIAVIAVALYAMTGQVASAQGDWCEANCKSLCTKIYGRAGAAQCFAQIPCANYAGRKCAPAAVVNARHITYCHSNKGKGTCR